MSVPAQYEPKRLKVRNCQGSFPNKLTTGGVSLDPIKSPTPAPDLLPSSIGKLVLQVFRLIGTTLGRSYIGSGLELQTELAARCRSGRAGPFLYPSMLPLQVLHGKRRRRTSGPNIAAARFEPCLPFEGKLQILLLLLFPSCSNQPRKERALSPGRRRRALVWLHYFRKPYYI